MAVWLKKRYLMFVTFWKHPLGTLPDGIGPFHEGLSQTSRQFYRPKTLGRGLGEPVPLWRWAGRWENHPKSVKKSLWNGRTAEKEVRDVCEILKTSAWDPSWWQRPIPRRAVTNITAVLRTWDPGYVPGRARTYGSEQVGAERKPPKKWYTYIFIDCLKFQTKSCFLNCRILLILEDIYFMSKIKLNIIIQKNLKFSIYNKMIELIRGRGGCFWNISDFFV